MEQPVILVMGTRPEGIKLLPLYFALQQAHIPVFLCSTTQHDHLLSDVFNAFDVKPDVEFGVMKHNQDLFHVTTQVLEKSKHLFSQTNPRCVIVQGDTTTAMAASLAAFYMHIPVVHVEAGLRTDSITSPFPEEMNRRFISMIAALHCAPTAMAVANLLAEQIDRSLIFHTGNTVVDALRIMREKLESSPHKVGTDLRVLVETAKKENKKIILLTAHRRESFNGGIERIFNAMNIIARAHENCLIVYPMHPNPAIQQALAASNIRACSNIVTMSAMVYSDLLYILMQADIVATDSGGICEEAISLEKPVVILRQETERMEAVWSGLGFLTGTDTQAIVRVIDLLLKDPIKNYDAYKLYGNGYASQKIVHIIQEKFFSLKNRAQITSDQRSLSL